MIIGTFVHYMLGFVCLSAISWMDSWPVHSVHHLPADGCTDKIQFFQREPKNNQSAVGQELHLLAQLLYNITNITFFIFRGICLFKVKIVVLNSRYFFFFYYSSKFKLWIILDWSISATSFWHGVSISALPKWEGEWLPPKDFPESLFQLWGSFTPHPSKGLCQITKEENRGQVQEEAGAF